MYLRTLLPDCCLHPTCGLMLLLSATCAAPGQDETLTSTSVTRCQLIINGSAIERLEFQDKAGRVVEIDQPAESVSLPAGEYRICTVILRGGYYGRGLTTGDGWFKLAPGQPRELQIGPPLELRVNTSRWGRVVTMDYELTDAAGCRYYDGESRALPKFTVFRDGRKIGSGSFEYG